MSLLYASLRGQAAGGGIISKERLHISAYTPALHRGRIACPGCDSDLDAKRGDINVHHFAHKAGAKCDPWRQGMTEWHRSWQELWDAERNEVRMERDGVVHIADVVTTDGMVVELQHSDLSREDVLAREAFYGNMTWVFDGGDTSRVILRGRNFIVYTLPHNGWAWTRKPALLDTPWGLYRLMYQRLSNPRVVLGKLTTLEEAGIVPDRMRFPFYTKDARVPPTHPDMVFKDSPSWSAYGPIDCYISCKNHHDRLPSFTFCGYNSDRVNHLTPWLFSYSGSYILFKRSELWLSKVDELGSGTDYNWNAYTEANNVRDLETAWYNALRKSLPDGGIDDDNYFGRLRKSLSRWDAKHQ